MKRQTSDDKEYHEELSPHHIRDLAQRSLYPFLRHMLKILYVETVETVQIVNLASHTIRAVPEMLLLCTWLKSGRPSARQGEREQ